jgi:hypothetical protein
MKFLIYFSLTILALFIAGVIFLCFLFYRVDFKRWGKDEYQQIIFAERNEINHKDYYIVKRYRYTEYGIIGGKTDNYKYGLADENKNKIISPNLEITQSIELMLAKGYDNQNNLITLPFFYTRHKGSTFHYYSLDGKEINILKVFNPKSYIIVMGSSGRFFYFLNPRNNMLSYQSFSNMEWVTPKLVKIKMYKNVNKTKDFEDYSDTINITQDSCIQKYFLK